MIGEASATSGFSQRLIRHYEKIGLIAPASRRDSGYRDYSTKDMHKLQFIGRARDLGFSIEEIRQLLGLWEDRDRSSSDVKALALARSAELKKRELAPRDMDVSLSIWPKAVPVAIAPSAPSSTDWRGHRDLGHCRSTWACLFTDFDGFALPPICAPRVGADADRHGPQHGTCDGGYARNACDHGHARRRALWRPEGQEPDGAPWHALRWVVQRAP